MDEATLDAQELKFRIAQLRLEVAEFRRFLRHATMNVVVMEELAEDGDFGEPEPEPRQTLPWRSNGR